MKKKYLIFALFPLIVAPCFFQAQADHFDPLPTEFVYSTEKLSHLHSTHLLTLEQIDKWEALLHQHLRNRKPAYHDQVRFFTYLRLAQRDAVFLSYNTHHSFTGSLDPLTKRIVLTFYPDYTDFPDYITDPYSEALADLVWLPYKERLEKEVKQRLPWVTPLPTVPPPSLNLKKQIQLMQARRHCITEEQLKMVHAWASIRGLTRFWYVISNEYMRSARIPLGQTVFVRSLLMMSLYDTLIATAVEKSRYDIPRPAKLDPSVVLLIPDPSSASYPSGHAAEAGAAATILSYFFPSECAYWECIAQEAANSRIWAGVHTPQDIEQGDLLGREVGEGILQAKVYPTIPGHCSKTP